MRKLQELINDMTSVTGRGIWFAIISILVSLPLSAGYVTYERGSGGDSSGVHVNNLNEDAQSDGFPTDALRDLAVALGYSTTPTDADLYMAARGETTNLYPTSHPLTTANGDNISANQYEEDCDYHILVTNGVTGDGCADLQKPQFLIVKALTEQAIEYGYDSNQQRLTATDLGYEDSCDGSDRFHEARGQTTGRCDGTTLSPPQASDCATYSSDYSLVDAGNNAISTCGAMTNQQYTEFINWASGVADTNAQQNCYASDLERTQATALGYDGDSCADGQLYARALGRRQVDHPSIVLLNISFTDGADSTNVQINDNQYEVDCDAFIAANSDVNGDGCADLQRSQFASIKDNHDAAQNVGFGDDGARTAALAASFTAGCDGANSYYASIGSTSNPTLNPACALAAPFTGLAGPGCWEDIEGVSWYQHTNYEKSDFACVLNNTSTSGPRFTDTTLASLTDGEFSYLKDCFFDMGDNRTVQGLRNCVTNTTDWDQATFPVREFSNATFGAGTGSCNLTMDQIEALGAFDDLIEGTYLSETKTLFDGDYCRKTDSSGEEVNCKEIVCDALTNPGTNSIFNSRSYMQSAMCGAVNRAYKQKAYHYEIKKHYFVEACQNPVVASSDDFGILDWPLIREYRVNWHGIEGRAPHQSQQISGVSYHPEDGPEDWELRSLHIGRFEHDPIPTTSSSTGYALSPSAGRKNLRIWSFGNVTRHRQVGYNLEVKFKNNICISGGIYQDHNDSPNTGNWYYALNFYRIPFPVSILPNQNDLDRNIRQRGAIDASDTTMTVALTGSPTNSPSVGTLQATSSGQTSFARDNFKASDIGAVKIISLPTQGTLTYRASAVTANMILPSGDLNELKYEPASGAPAINNNYTNFTFRTYAPWSSVETARDLTTFACREVPDFEPEAANMPQWSWPNKATTSHWGAHNSGGFGAWTRATCPGDAESSTMPGASEWTTPSSYQKVLAFTNIPEPSNANSYTPPDASLSGLSCTSP